jgi:DNA-binding CsgD family transcriptional regulator
VLFTSVLSGILCALYVWKGFSEGFFIGTWVIALMNFLYIPAAAIFKRKCFSYFYLVYAVILVFMIAFEKTFLFNNYTALFLVCIVIMIKPQVRFVAISLYIAAICVAFSINGESVFHFLIHLTRTFWFFGTVFFVTENNFERKKLILYEDEIKILAQLCDGKIYQKEVEGFSENTVYRKLKAARERNGNLTREQLVELFKKEQIEKNSLHE